MGSFSAQPALPGSTVLLRSGTPRRSCRDVRGASAPSNAHVKRSDGGFYLSGEDPRFYKREIDQYPARLSGGFQSPTEIKTDALKHDV